MSVGGAAETGVTWRRFNSDGGKGDWAGGGGKTTRGEQEEVHKKGEGMTNFVLLCLGWWVINSKKMGRKAEKRKREQGNSTTGRRLKEQKGEERLFDQTDWFLCILPDMEESAHYQQC